MSVEDKLLKTKENDEAILAEHNALLTYANGVTGADDVRLGDAIKSLADGYGQGGGGGMLHTHGTKESYGGTSGYLDIPIPDENYSRYYVIARVVGYWYKNSSGNWAYQDGIVFGETGLNDINIPFGATIEYPPYKTPAYTNTAGKAVAEKNIILSGTVFCQSTASPIGMANVNAPSITTVNGVRVLRQTLRKNVSASNVSPHYGTRWEYDLFAWND